LCWLCAQVFGNQTHTVVTSPRLAFSLQPSELVVSSRLWSSTTVLEGSRLTPVLAGFSLFTLLRNLHAAGGEARSLGPAGSAAMDAMQARLQNVSLSSNDLGVGLPVGAAAYTSGAGIHAFGFLYLRNLPHMGSAARQEL
jgi:hypothetical protein